MCLKSIILNILTVKNLIFNFFLVFNLHALSFSLSEYKNFYSTDGAQVIESLEKIDDKYHFLLKAPLKDSDGNDAIIRFSRKTKEQYVRSEKDGKPTGWNAFYENGKWSVAN